MLWETKNIIMIIKTRKGDVQRKWRHSDMHWGTKSKRSSPFSGRESSIHRKEGKEVEGRNRAAFHFLPRQWHSFLFSFCAPPQESSPFSHIHFPLLTTRVGKFPQTNPSSWVSRCHSVSCQRTLLTTAWGIRPIQLMSSYWRRDVPSIENLVFLLFAFSAKRKKKPQIGRKKRIKEKPVSVCESTHVYVCVTKWLCFFVTDANKKDLGSLCPGGFKGGRNMWPVGPLGCLARLGEKVGRKIKWNGDKLSRACEFRQETGEWFELDAVWAILEWYWLINCSWKHLKRRRRKEFLENVLPHPGICSSRGGKGGFFSPYLWTGLSRVASEECFKCVCVSLHSFLYLIV